MIRELLHERDGIQTMINKAFSQRQDYLNRIKIYHIDKMVLKDVELEEKEVLGSKMTGNRQSKMVAKYLERKRIKEEELANKAHDQIEIMVDDVAKAEEVKLTQGHSARLRGQEGGPGPRRRGPAERRGHPQRARQRSPPRATV